MSSVLAFSAASTSSTECAVIGVGVLGTSLCRQILESPNCKDWKVTGITKTANRHDQILQQVLGGTNEATGRFTLETADQQSKQQPQKKYKHCVFCAPPSGFEDYPAAVEEAIANVWAGPSDGGAFVFTSSGGIYGPGDDPSQYQVVNEQSPLPDPNDNPRSAKLMKAEQVVQQHGGMILRLAGLYTLERGAHNYWLVRGNGQVAGRPDGMINLLHYDDAAGAVLAALTTDDVAVQGGRVFLISDGNPLTRQQICESSFQSDMYRDTTLPTFLGDAMKDPMGKIYDGSASNQALQWEPRYPSFDDFMKAAVSSSSETTTAGTANSK